MKYPNRLRELRKITNVKATDLADLLDVTFQHYYALERGDRQLSASQITKLSTFLSVTAGEVIGADVLLENDKQNGTDISSEIPMPNKKIANLIARANALPDQKQGNIIEALEALVKYHEDNKNK
jgi:transcriptional regulator with XRE-family HTH domain